VNKYHHTKKLQDEYSEFRSKFFSIWGKNEFYNMIQYDISEFNTKLTKKVSDDGIEQFNEIEYMKNLENLSDNTKQTLLHMHAISYNFLTDCSQGKVSDLKQQFLLIIFYLLSNPNMTAENKANFKDTFVTVFTAPKPKKKSNKKTPKVTFSENGETAEKNEKEGAEKVEEEKKEEGGDTTKLIKGIKRFKHDNLTMMIRGLVKFCTRALVYFVLKDIYLIGKNKENMYLIDTLIPEKNINAYENMFYTNFSFINPKFKLETYEELWMNHILGPLLKAKRDDNDPNIIEANKDEVEATSSTIVDFMDPANIVESMLMNKVVILDKK